MLEKTSSLAAQTKAESLASNNVGVIPVRVVANDLLCDDTRRVVLSLPEWAEFDYLPGQYIDIVLDNGEKRSFSIAQYNVDAHQIVLYVKHIEKGFFTHYVFEYLTLNTIWMIEAPLGNFILRYNQRPILMLAGSTGIAPLLPMLAQLQQSGDKRKVFLYWGTRYAQRLFVHDELSDVAQHYSHFHYVPVVSRPHEAPADEAATAIDETTPWSGRSGYVQTEAIADLCDLSGYDIYASGSPKMIDAVTQACLAAGADKNHVYLDVFNFQTTSHEEC